MSFQAVDPIPSPKPVDQPVPRRHGRLPQEGLVTSLGPIIDLSGGGMQVRTRRVPSDAVVVTITGPGISLAVRCRVVWSRRCGFFRYLVGLAFEDLSEAQGRSLASMACSHRWRRTM